MALTSDSPTRANIRIEIKNDFTESMDEDIVEGNGELSEGEVEDGEISDAKNTQLMKNETRNKIFIPRSVASSRSENQWSNGEGGFTTGVDIFGKDEQEKLQTRAQRFGIDPTESKSMTDDQLLELHNSLGITDADQVDTRFDAIHMYGTEEMSTQDVFSYFGKYGPASIEWLNDTSCNVVWHDKISAARAFIALSKPIAGMPVSGECNPFKEKEEDNESKLFKKGRSILLIRSEEEMDEDNKENDKASRTEGKVDISDINLPIPPGYWRLGYPHEKSEHILLRFAKRTDKKPFRAERFSEYYKKYGNPNFGGMVGLISESKKKRIKEINFEDIEEEPTLQKGNPWGSLAKNWNRDVTEPEIPARIDKEEPIVKIKMPYQTGPSKALMDRIGESQKRVHSDKEEEEEKEKPKKSKVPRMRMYADEEEARIKKAKERKQIRVLEEIEEEILHKQKSKIPDLRSRLGKKEVTENRRKLEIRRPINYKKPEPVINHSSSEYSDEEEEVRVQQRSKVAVVVRKPHRPAVASTVWSRLDMEREKQKQIRIKREISDSEKKRKSSDSGSEDDSDSDEEYNRKYKKTLSKTVGERPGFKTADLKSRLGFQNTEHKSPLRIEINNDHYKKEKA